MKHDFKIMGVINVTPDSFSDGGKYLHTSKAIQHGLELIQNGANILDVGGESTRPGADVVSTNEEISRVVPVIQGIRDQNKEIVLSIDTSKPKVMQAALDAGANFINDVNALQTPGALEVVASSHLPVCLMHKQGDPKTMQDKPNYTNVLLQVMEFFQQKVDNCLRAGINKNNIILDPGIGFGKTLEHNMILLKNIKKLKSLGFPLLVGVSRKTMIGKILNAKVEDRLYGSLAIAQYAYTNGTDILRVHDVKATHDVLKITKSLLTI